MIDLVDYVSALIVANDGQIVGKTRLQKMTYLLEAKSIGFGIEFDYHDFGPYSAEVAFAADDAESLGYIDTEERFGYHSVPYTVFKSTSVAPSFDDNAKIDRIRVALGVMAPYSALVLELAATAAYLERSGYTETRWDEVRKRKPLKATDDRVESAKGLLKELDL